MDSTNNFQLSHLHSKMIEVYSLNEIRQLCFYMNVNHEELAGDTIGSKIQFFLEHLDRRDQISALILRLEKERPATNWKLFQPAESDAEPPFKGLCHFTEKDAHLFFGRDALIATLVDHLSRHQFLAVIGASGSGKSSVVHAGVIPAIRQGKVELHGQTSDLWPVHIITPGSEPLKALAATLTQHFESVSAMKSLLADMRSDSQNLSLWLYRNNLDKNNRTVLIVDQFEELFTQCDDQEERHLFVENLVNAVQSGKKESLTLILTLRADFYAHAVQFSGLVPLLKTRQEIVEMMSLVELKQAIKQPIKRGGWQLQPGLLDTILTDLGAGENRKPEPGALPLLSHALLETWKHREDKRLTLASYQKTGGVRQAITKTAEKIYAQLSPVEQAITQNILMRLTELGEDTEDTRRRAPISELIPKTNDSNQVQTVLALLADARLVTIDEKNAEVAHEALIREWPRLRGWLDNNREGLRLRQQLTDDAQAWEDDAFESSYLYRGVRLNRINEWSNENKDSLNELEWSFLHASIEEKTRLEAAQLAAKRRRQLTIAGVIFISLLFILTFSYLYITSDQAIRNLLDAQVEVQVAADEAARIVNNCNFTIVRGYNICLLEVNNDIALSFESNLNKEIERDVFRLRVRSNIDYVCETFDLSSETDTKIQLWSDSGNPFNPPIENDNREVGDPSSFVEFRADYTGFLYIVVDLVKAPENEDTQFFSYSLHCLQMSPTLTPFPVPTTQN